jgi:hypothetical protein
MLMPEAGLIKGAWNADEDELLVELVREIGAKKWSVIAARMPGRIGKQVRLFLPPLIHSSSSSAHPLSSPMV